MKKDLKHKFYNYVRRNELLNSGNRLLLAVSGGMDSMVLLDLFHQWQARLKILLGAVHLNHGIRQETARRDQELVKGICEKVEIPLHILKADVPAHARENGLSLEEAGHKLRKILFEELACQEGYDRIATAHHQDDQAETILSRIISGTGLQGLAGIRLRKNLWIRPLLCATRQEIEQYAIQQNIQYTEDETNKDLNIPRNRIRHDLLPYLQRNYNDNV